MNTTTIQPKINSYLIVMMGLLAVLLVAGILAHNSFGLSDRTAFFVLAALGFTMCALGKLGQGGRYGWWNLRHILGYMLGAAALLLTTAEFFHWQILWISSEREAILALAALMAVKIGIAATYPRKSS
jgi:hypothetical protein